MPGRTLLRRLTLAAVVVVALAGCQMRIELATVVAPDGSGRLELIVAADEELRQQSEQQGEDPFEGFDEAELPPEWEVEEYRDGEFLGVRAIRPFDEVAELDDIATELQELGDAGGGEQMGGEGPFDLSNLRVVRDGDAFGFEMEMPAAEMGELAGTGSEEGSAEVDVDPAMLRMFMRNLFDFRVRAQLPGEVVDHDADRVTDDGLVWEIDVAATEARTLRASSTVGAGGGAGGPVALGAVGLVLGVAGVGWWTVRRRDGGQPPVSEPDDEPRPTDQAVLR